jgi:hypothetical protein
MQHDWCMAEKDGLTGDTQRMQTDPPAGVSASPIADNVMTWYDSPLSPARDTGARLAQPRIDDSSSIDSGR